MSEHRPIIWREWLVLKRAGCTCGWVCGNRTKKHQIAMLDFRQHLLEGRAEALRKRAAA